MSSSPHPPTIQTAILAQLVRREPLRIRDFWVVDMITAGLGLHRPTDDGSGDPSTAVCGVCCGPSESWERLAVPWPCDTVKVMAAALGLKEGDWR